MHNNMSTRTLSERASAAVVPEERGGMASWQDKVPVDGDYHLQGFFHDLLIDLTRDNPDAK